MPGSVRLVELKLPAIQVCACPLSCRLLVCKRWAGNRGPPLQANGIVLRVLINPAKPEEKESADYADYTDQEHMPDVA